MQWLIVGLGNPGAEYEKSRHNVGFMVLDLFSEKVGAKWQKGRLYHFFDGKRGDTLYLCIKPMTYMNLSGVAVSEAFRSRNFSPEEVLVVHDDLDLPLGEVRIKKDGGDGGHKGVRSVIEAIGRDFARMRVGIGRPQGKGEVIDYVLSPFSKGEWEKVARALEDAAFALELILDKGLEWAVSSFHNLLRRRPF